MTIRLLLSKKKVKTILWCIEFMEYRVGIKLPISHHLTKLQRNIMKQMKEPAKVKMPTEPRVDLTNNGGYNVFYDKDIQSWETREGELKRRRKNATK